MKRRGMSETARRVKNEMEGENKSSLINKMKQWAHTQGS
jgi:hypothetical protein